MKVVIVGAGISGLTTYLFLDKLLRPKLDANTQLEILLYDSHEAPKNADRPSPSLVAPSAFAQGVGGVLGIWPNGLRVLKELDEDLCRSVANRGYPVSTFRFRNSHGTKLADFPTTNFTDPPLHTVMITRQAVWDALRDRVPDSAVSRKGVSRVLLGSHSQGPRIQFADGSPDDEADLVIGADGVRSVVKRAVTGDGKKDNYPAIYEGLVGVGGFIPSSYLPNNEATGVTTMTFGADGFFGYGACSSKAGISHDAISPCIPGTQAFWWSTYALEHPIPREEINKDDIVHQLQSRHSGWKDPVIQKVTEEVSSIDTIYPTWTTPDLLTWEKGGIVLVGDAAHALQPSSGQGVSQALEDAEMLGMLLAENLGRKTSSDQEAIRLAAKIYCKIRMPRAKKISDYTKRLGDMKRKKGFLGEWMTYIFIWLGGKLPRDSNSKYLLGYDPRKEIEKITDSEG